MIIPFLSRTCTDGLHWRTPRKTESRGFLEADHCSRFKTYEIDLARNRGVRPARAVDSVKQLVVPRLETLDDISIAADPGGDQGHAIIRVGMLIARPFVGPTRR
jgi:hypothetical protein